MFNCFLAQKLPNLEKENISLISQISLSRVWVF